MHTPHATLFFIHHHLASATASLPVALPVPLAVALPVALPVAPSILLLLSRSLCYIASRQGAYPSLHHQWLIWKQLVHLFIQFFLT
jgi:hypothetical protein